MEIEKILLLDAAPARVWELLLDPNAMGACVPGMQSIEVISDVEYLASMQVKISFISARFKLKTRITEMRPPHYLRAEGTGEDTSVASSLKQTSEMFLAEQEGGKTELRMKVKVDVFGRLGTFGLGVMKTKADRLWEEFGVNLGKRLVDDQAQEPALMAEPAPIAASPVPVVEPHLAKPLLSVNGAPASVEQTTDPGWWSRLMRTLSPVPVSATGSRNIRIEMRRADTVLTVEWPMEKAEECARWLREALK